MTDGERRLPIRAAVDGGDACRHRAIRGQSSLTEPPAAAIFSFAEPENACALTCRAVEISPVPRTLTGRPARTAPFATRSSTVTSPPFGYSDASLSRLTTWNSTRNGLRKPLSLGSRMCSGICPPSKRAETAPRALLPFVPRPAVLPRAPASPRPTRVLAVFAPGAGRKWCGLSGESAMSVHLLDGDQVRHGPDHSANLGPVLLDHDVTHALEAERPQGLALRRGPADPTLDLTHLQPAHDDAPA